MKILFVNNYLYLRGGAEVYVLQIAEMLRSHGHDVCFLGTDYRVDNSIFNPKYTIQSLGEDSGRNFIKKIKEGSRIFYSVDAVRMIRKTIIREQPDIVHFNNIHHKLSPALAWEVKRAGLPLVWTLHDFKFVCPSYTMIRNRRLCSECRKSNFNRVFINKCLKQSYSKSLLVMLQAYIYNKLLKIESMVDCFLPISSFMMDMFVSMGFNGKMRIFPNFVDLNSYTPKDPVVSNKAIYFGRLSSEKGLYTLLNAVKDLDIDFEFVGEGPEMEQLSSMTKDKNEKCKIYFPGHLNQDELNKKIADSLFVVMPSEWYEPFGRTVLESFAMGRPVIGSRIGAIPELVIDNVTGLTFTPGDSADLKKKMAMLLEDRELALRLGKNARKIVEKRYQATVVLPILMEIYDEVISNASRMRTGSLTLQ